MEFDNAKKTAAFAYGLYEKIARFSSKSIFHFLGVYSLFYFLVYTLIISIAWGYEAHGESEKEQFWNVLEFERKIYHLQYAKEYVSACIKLRDTDDTNQPGVCKRASNAYDNYSRIGEQLKTEVIQNSSYEEMIVQMNLNISQARDRIKQENFKSESKERYEVLTSNTFLYGLSSLLIIIMIHLLYKSHSYSKKQT
ncbi:hypothetical protein N474_12465 [Pseudoalteromonas luteoviolacea CPMOR-2]|uniref:hypothetical protein n=1 Tax=Pseudoalteromonas luteoviolacea TaxID=43657 RepID=UPI0007B07A14|nr:hypothetical protein [Pseudoalteromonas luteoviolacea]KZN56086.1 hypothetical protein N474_12465 [Pseudoalteromonas luteoviolacea CPMOR-2]